MADAPAQRPVTDAEKKLKAPFRPNQIKLKPTDVREDRKSPSGHVALALPYIDGRAVMDRLDEVVGVHGWEDEYTFLPSGDVVCKLRVIMDGEWVSKQDIGSPGFKAMKGEQKRDDSDKEVMKSAVSDALKRVAVKFGIGRYLYAIKRQYLPYDKERKRWVPVDQNPGPSPEEQAERAAAQKAAAAPQTQPPPQQAPPPAQAAAPPPTNAPAAAAPPPQQQAPPPAQAAAPPPTNAPAAAAPPPQQQAPPPQQTSGPTEQQAKGTPVTTPPGTPRVISARELDYLDEIVTKLKYTYDAFKQTIVRRYKVDSPHELTAAQFKSFAEGLRQLAAKQNIDLSSIRIPDENGN